MIKKQTQKTISSTMQMKIFIWFLELLTVHVLILRTFYDLKKQLNIECITILDKTIPSVKGCYITDHVNRSGFNFLIAKTPINKLPVFPGMSNIYNEIEGLRPIVVHTVGPDRFISVEDPKIIISESVGLISPLWHYVKTKVYARTDH